MKRCPQCEFIYEDDQSLCDMDGALLVFDARTLPNLHALATVDVPVAPKAHWRHRTFPAMAALILATVLSLVYFVSTQRTAPVTAPMPSIAPVSSSAASTEANNNSTAPSSDLNQTPSAAPEVNGAAVTTKTDATPAKNETKSEPTKTNSTAAASTSAAAAKKVAAKPSPTPERTPEEPKKDDSKVGSILKKTGRLLKKPFKL